MIDCVVTHFFCAFIFRINRVFRNPLAREALCFLFPFQKFSSNLIAKSIALYNPVTTAALHNRRREGTIRFIIAQSGF